MAENVKLGAFPLLFMRCKRMVNGLEGQRQWVANLLGFLGI
jgi:hypothetical protein